MRQLQAEVSMKMFLQFLCLGSCLWREHQANSFDRCGTRCQPGADSAWCSHPQGRKGRWHFLFSHLGRVPTGNRVRRAAGEGMATGTSDSPARLNKAPSSSDCQRGGVTPGREEAKSRLRKPLDEGVQKRNDRPTVSVSPCQPPPQFPCGGGLARSLPPVSAVP